MSHITDQEQAILTSIQAAKGVGYRDGMKASKARIEELEGMIATLDQENRQLNARNERLQDELEHFRKHIVFYQDIAMVGEHSAEYEDGFWDAVDFVKQHQTKDKK
jgi:predicted RNase H-like nuclease (RuvC/YqgF family)